MALRRVENLKVGDEIIVQEIPRTVTNTIEYTPVVAIEFKYGDVIKRSTFRVGDVVEVKVQTGTVEEGGS